MRLTLHLAIGALLAASATAFAQDDDAKVPFERVVNGRALTPAAQRYADGLAERYNGGEAIVETMEWVLPRGPSAVGIRVRFTTANLTVERMRFADGRTGKGFLLNADLTHDTFARAAGRRGDQVVLVTDPGMNHMVYGRILEQAWPGLPAIERHSPRYIPSRAEANDDADEGTPSESEGLPLPEVETRRAEYPPLASTTTPVARDATLPETVVFAEAPEQDAGIVQRLEGETGAGGGWGSRLALAGRESIVSAKRRHDALVKSRGYGIYFGGSNNYRRLSTKARTTFLQALADRAGSDVNVNLRKNRPRQTSCIGWVLEHVGKAYRAAGRGDVWAGIRRRVIEDGARANTLARELRQDGWTVLYFNPDLFNPEDGSDEHTSTAAQVIPKAGLEALKAGRPYDGPLGRYYRHIRGYDVQVDDLVVDYNPSWLMGDTPLDTSGLEKLSEVPFWFGLARGGGHAFLGSGAVVSENHYGAGPEQGGYKMIEERPLTDFPWDSGLIVVPPGTWR